MTEVDQRQALLEMAAGGRTAELQSTVLQMLAGEGMDPTTSALLAQSLAPSPRPADDVDGDGDGVDDDVLDRAERRRRAIRILRRRFADLRDELEELRHRNERFAAAVGACYRCWGGDRRCDVCGGQGHPGSGAPDRRLFDELVAPALRPRSVSPPAPHGGAGQPIGEREV